MSTTSLTFSSLVTWSQQRGDMYIYICMYMGVSENSGTPKSSILIGFSIINHPFWGTLFLETPIYIYITRSTLISQKKGP